MVFELGALYPSEEEARRAERELSQDLEELRSHERYSDIVHRDEVATRGAIAFARAEVGERGLALLLELSRELEREIRGRLAK